MANLYGTDRGDVAGGTALSDGNDLAVGDFGGAGSGIDTLYGETGDDTLFAIDGNDLVYGGSGNDVIAGDNTLFGGIGNFIVLGSTGVDTLTGGTVDAFVLFATDGTATDAITDRALWIDNVNIEGMVVSSGLGTTPVAFDNGAHLASTGSLRTGADFA